ncbi:MAG TPA: ABC transporter permease [Solirubrobacterales bacterium]|nr:ABC transporter permease [Solirubrobacterales bacterium]
MKRWLYPVLLLAILLAAWQIAADSGLLAELFSLENYLVPSPSEVASALWDNRALILENTWVTLKEVLIGFGLGLLAGVAFAFACHLSETVRRATYPLLIASQAIPIIAIAPILVVLFGFGIWPKLVIVALICFFPVTVNTLDGLRSVDPATIKLMRTLDGSRWQIMRRVEAPTALPYTFSGAKIGVAVAVIGAVFAEWSAATVGHGGLGWLVHEDSSLLETARLFADILVLALMSVALFGLLALVERRVVTWR